MGLLCDGTRLNEWSTIRFAIGIETVLLGIGLVGIEYEEYPRSGTMIRATCALGTLVLLVLNAIYAYTGVNTSFIY